MTLQEILWENKLVTVTGILSRSGKLHYSLRKFVGLTGKVRGEAKNGMLLVEFTKQIRAIPAGCVVEYGLAHRAGYRATQSGSYIKADKVR